MASTTYLTSGDVQTFANALQTGYNVYNQFSSGTSGIAVTSCPNQAPTQAVIEMLSKISATDRTQLLNAWAAANPGVPFPSSDPARLAFAAAGGSDCQATTTGGKTLQSVFNALIAKYASSTTWTTTGYNPSLPGGGATGSISATDTGGGSDLGNEFAKIWDALKQTAENIATATVAGAVTGARTTTTAASTASGAASGLTLLFPLILLGGGFLLVRALRK